MKREFVKIGRIQFLKDCAKDMTFTQFKNDFAHAEKFDIDLEKAFIILGGKKRSSKKEDIKEK
jgi:hypothetical protein